jgi:DNA-binding Xre family transcriptional regulator
MTDLITRKKKRITITASSEGVEIAENALIRLGFDSKSNFAKTHFLARSTVTKFFHCQPIQLDSFKKICQELKLDWRKIARLSEEQQSQQLEIIKYY